MTRNEYRDIIDTLATRFAFSVTSGRRTVKRNKAVGGVPNSKHLTDEADDCVLDDKKDKAAFMREARKRGLGVLDEGDHVHLQNK